MSQAPTPFRAISLADLVALNEEISALVRAGVPLGSGLTGAARDLPRRLGSYSAELGRRLERGESLSQAVSKPGEFPPIYRAVITAGDKAGRLPVALEGLATSAQRLAEIRRVVLLAMLYPLFILLMAYGFFFFYVAKTLPTMLGLFGRRPPWLIRQLSAIHDALGPWVYVAPWALIIGYGLWRYGTSRALVMQSSRLFFWLPPVDRMLRNARASAMSEVLALLVEHNIPLHEAIVLAAEATGDATLIRGAKETAAALTRGAQATPAHALGAGLPPLLNWLISTGIARGSLVAMLRASADSYRRRALRSADWIRFSLPILLMVVVGGSATLLYALTVFVPHAELLRHMGSPTFH